MPDSLLPFTFLRPLWLLGIAPALLRVVLDRQEQIAAGHVLARAAVIGLATHLC